MPIYTFNPSFTHPILWWGYTIYTWIGLHYESYKIDLKGGGEGRKKEAGLSIRLWGRNVSYPLRNKMSFQCFPLFTKNNKTENFLLLLEYSLMIQVQTLHLGQRHHGPVVVGDPVQGIVPQDTVAWDSVLQQSYQDTAASAVEAS